MSRKIATAVMVMIVLTGCRFWQQGRTEIARSAAEFVLAPLVGTPYDRVLTQSAFRDQSVVAVKSGSDVLVPATKRITSCPRKAPAIDHVVSVRVERRVIHVFRSAEMKPWQIRYEERIVVTAPSERS